MLKCIFNLIIITIVPLVINMNILKAEQQVNPLNIGFVNLTQIDPSIVINIKYASKYNILGKVVDGLEQNKAVITREAANALREVQQDLAMKGFAIVVYSAYIPMKSYNKLIELEQNQNNDSKNLYYPFLTNEELSKAGYLKEKMDLNRGGSIEVSIIPLSGKLKSSPSVLKKSYKNNKIITYLDDGTIDMGTSYDFFDELSSPNNDQIGIEEKNNRILLKETMENHGFKQSKLVWWKYTYIREPFIDSKFDFEI